MRETVTGRTYTKTRPRGFAPWNPKPETQALLQTIDSIFDEYSAQLPLTNRQIFYRLVGTIGYEKTEKGYARLCETLSRARRAGLVSFDNIRDDGTSSEPAGGFHSVAQFWRSVQSWGRSYDHSLADEQPRHVELWVEASGMVPQAAQVAHEYGVDVYSAGGFNGLTDKYETARRLADAGSCTILHMGDYDPSGCAIIDSLADDINAFVDGLTSWGSDDLEWVRVAVTPDQISRYNLPTAPQKRTDKRGEQMDDTVQAEALPPDVLARELREAIEAIVDLDLIEDMRLRGESERAEIVTVLDGLLA